MNKAFLLALLLVSSEALGQIKLYKSGDRINADEMNQNFQELVRGCRSKATYRHTR